MGKRMVRQFSLIIAAVSASVLFAAPLRAEEVTASTASRKPVLLEGKATPLRVFARPASKAYGNTNDPAAVAQDKVAPFQTFYVYTRPSAPGSGNGWYEVGQDAKGAVVGWMKAGEVVEARQERDVRVMIAKSQMEALVAIMKEIVAGGRKSQLSGDELMASLMGVAVSVSGEIKPLPTYKNLGETSVLPAFLKTMPYSSQIMSLSDEVWKDWSDDQKTQFLDQLDARILDFEAIHGQRTGWIRKNADDEDGKTVFPIPVELLP